jgi:iron complex outermembrane receptor protein
MYRLKYLFLASAAATALTFGTAEAQEAAPHDADAAKEGSEEIVVTARRRSETLFQAPATVTAISGETLRNAGITTAKDIIALVPNAVIQDDSESYNMFINIRGMRLVDVQAEPNFGLFRNGLYAGGHRSNLGAQVDIKRVEVLRGPQGGLYGRNAVGGAVNIVYATPTPGDEFGGYVKGSYGSYDRFELEGAVTVPVNDQVAVRLTGWHFSQTGSEIYNETLDEDVLANSDKGLRASVSADLMDNLNVTWMAEIQKVEGPTLRTYAPLGVTNGGILSPPETYDRIRRDTPSIGNMQQSFFSQKITYDTGIGQFALNASYRNYDFDGISDSDQTAIPITAGTAVRKTDILRNEGTEDIYVEGIWTSPDDRPFTWILGVSYFDETFDFARVIQSNRDLRPQGYGFVRYWIGFPAPGTNIKTESISAFVSANYDITDQFSVSAGLRWSQDTKRLHFDQHIMLEGLQPAGNPALEAFILGALGGIYPTYLIDREDEFTFTAPSLGMKYEVNDDLNIYASYSTGFRPGAFNLSPTTIDTIPYDQESAANYEIGVKSRWLDGKLNVNLAAFYMTQDDMLLAQVTSLGGVDRTYLANVGTARTYGIELEALAQITPWLNAGLSIGWLDAKFEDAIANLGKPNQLILSGRQIPATREWTVNFRLDAQVPIGPNVDFIGTAALRYEQGGMLGDYYINYKYGTLTKIDLSAGVLINGNARITAYVENALDEHINQFYYYNTATNVTEGRTYGLEMTYEF